MNMPDLPSILLLIALLPLLIVDLFFAVELAAGLARGRSTAPTNAIGDVVVVIPAHNEAAVIAQTLGKLRESISDGMQMLVVADNCSDDTASIARSAGAEVIERTDAERRGKGFALAFARDHLQANPPQAVIVFDADCSASAKSLRNLVNSCLARGRPFQAIYLFEPDINVGPMVQISSFAFLIKNLVRQRGLQRLAGRVHLTGTGMCMPWPLFAQADLATASIVEDLRLGLELADVGAPPQLAENSLVWSIHASADETLSQRSRWEGGFLATTRATAPRLLARGLREGSPGTILAGLDLLVPPLALFAMINATALGLTLLCAVTGLTTWAPALALVVTGSFATFFLLLAWWREGRTTLSAGALLRIPLYAAWKLPMYAGLVRKGAPAEWNRTARAQETNREGR
jgi:cellulose synthase/poly-beta-1,6-N-acetylglucosamine synthase-like glycosyltransferase